MKVIIFDTSCLIVLEKINRFDILYKLFENVVISPQVAEEYGRPLPDFIKIQNLLNEETFNNLTKVLDKGEASSIALAVKYKNSLLIMDEKKGRKVACDLGLNTVGTLRIILEAKYKNIIPSAKEILLELERNKFRFSKSVFMEILRLSNEL